METYRWKGMFNLAHLIIRVLTECRITITPNSDETSFTESLKGMVFDTVQRTWAEFCNSHLPRT